MGPGRVKEWKPTPQPGDCVKARICASCGKRAKNPVTVFTSVHENTEGIARITRRTKVRGCDDEIDEVDVRLGSVRTAKIKNRRRVVHSCCSRSHDTHIGTVERTVWSFHEDGVVKQFFLVVFIPKLGKRHWATLDTVERTEPVSLLADLLEELDVERS